VPALEFHSAAAWYARPPGSALVLGKKVPGALPSLNVATAISLRKVPELSCPPIA
jgi:hypothetical protein